MLLFHTASMTALFIEDIVERCNRRFVNIGGDFVLIEDSPINCSFLRITDWREAWAALYVRKLKFGQFTEHREIIDYNKYVPFGASEIIMEALRVHALDAAVLACDGAGTVITNRPEIVQGIGGRMSGLLYTTPRKNVIQRLEKEGATVLDHEKARIDCVRGAKKALECYRRVAVTVTAGKDIERLRALSPDVVTFVVHTTGVTAEQAEYAVKADIVWGCASKFVREITGPHSLVQLGVGIPVFVLTEKGLNVVKPRICELSSQTGDALEKRKKEILSGATYVIHHKREGGPVEVVMEKCQLPVLRAGSVHPLI